VESPVRSMGVYRLTDPHARLHEALPCCEVCRPSRQRPCLIWSSCSLSIEIPLTRILPVTARNAPPMPGLIPRIVASIHLRGSSQDRIFVAAPECRRLGAGLGRTPLQRSRSSTVSALVRPRSSAHFPPPLTFGPHTVPW
jgi:hypothetical protein